MGQENLQRLGLMVSMYLSKGWFPAPSGPVSTASVSSQVPNSVGWPRYSQHHKALNSITFLKSIAALACNHQSSWLRIICGTPWGPFGRTPNIIFGGGGNPRVYVLESNSRFPYTEHALLPFELFLVSVLLHDFFPLGATPSSFRLSNSQLYSALMCWSYGSELCMSVPGATRVSQQCSGNHIVP